MRKDTSPTSNVEWETIFAVVMVMLVVVMVVVLMVVVMVVCIWWWRGRRWCCHCFTLAISNAHVPF